MLDGHHTTYDWQEHTGSVCVWAVGSFEQHSHHMPLATDNLLVDYFADKVAKALDATLLPSLPFGTCLEQSGFRGSMTLRPETLMQIVRDVADEVERQNFSILVLLNGHGGNHSLVPVCRDINRLNRPLKIVLANYWEFADPSAGRESKKLGATFHADEWETSLMLSLFPRHVRDVRTDRPIPKDEPHPLTVQDLTTFGMGHFNSTGAGGFPSYASRKKGDKIVASLLPKLIAHIQDRIARLQKDRRYSGSGGIALRPMTAADIPDGMRLKTLAGWNQTEADWEMYLELASNGCFAAVHNGRVIGTVDATHYGRCGWIAAVLVHPEFRNRGIATRLMSQALEALADCTCVKLDAAPAGEPIYRKLGFVEEYGISRMACECLPPTKPTGNAARAATANDLNLMAAKDKQVLDVSRKPVLAGLLERAPASAWILRAGSSLQAACFGRDGSHYHQVGPVIADSLDDATAVASKALHKLVGHAVVVDVPDAQTGMKEWLSARGFMVQRPFLRMVRGKNIAGNPSRLYATGGPDLG